MILSGLLGITVAGSGIILNLVFQSSPSDTDQIWSWIIITYSVLYLCHPVLIYWLFRIAHNTLALGFNVTFIVLSAVFLLSAIEVAARP
jgi:hypothetical protein